MRFVPVKSTQAQWRLAVLTARQGWVFARTAVINRLRGVLSEFGIVLPLKAATVRSRAGEQLDTVPGWVQTVCRDLQAELQRLDERAAAYDEHIWLMAQADDRARALIAMPGIGPITASALLAGIGYSHDFTNGRQFAARLGLAPGQYSWGGENRLGHITNAADAYLREGGAGHGVWPV